LRENGFWWEIVEEQSTRDALFIKAKIASAKLNRTVRSNLRARTRIQRKVDKIEEEIVLALSDFKDFKDHLEKPLAEKTAENGLNLLVRLYIRNHITDREFEAIGRRINAKTKIYVDLQGFFDEWRPDEDESSEVQMAWNIKRNHRIVEQIFARSETQPQGHVVTATE
jgi:hypothetical protein